MPDLSQFSSLAAEESGLVVVSTSRADGTIQASLVNAGVFPHPVTDVPTVAFVTYGRAKLANLRARPWATVTARSGWQWSSVEGVVDIIGPDDSTPGAEDQDVPALLRAVFTAAGGTHDDWDAYDRTMAEQRRAAVLVTPRRAYSN
jgi:PPOX class probable F420-dependent enzyme